MFHLKSTTLNALVCPACKGQLEFKEKTPFSPPVETGQFRCISCSLVYKSLNEIPILYHNPVADSYPYENKKMDQFLIVEKTLAQRLEKGNKNHFEKDNLLQTLHRNDLTRFKLKIAVLFGWGILFFWMPGLPWLALGCFLLFMDYLRYRNTCYHVGQSEYARLKKMFEEDKIQEYDIQSEDENRLVPEPEMEGRSDHRGSVIDSLLSQFLSSFSRVGVNLGCGCGANLVISKPYLNRGLDFIGIDICQRVLEKYRSLFNQDAILANAYFLPFRSESMDFVNGTDVLEHFYNPMAGLSEIYRILKPGGIGIIAVPNRLRVHLSMINPLVVLESLVGSWFSRVLPPSEKILLSNEKTFFHTAYALSEIRDLVIHAGFRILYLKCKTYAPCRYEKIMRFLEKIPLFNRLNRYIIAVIHKSVLTK